MVSCLEVGVISFLASFVFALGGVGAAVVIIPILVFLGVPFSVARPTGLFANFCSMTSATVHNFKKGLIDYKLSIPIVVASVVASPIGAYTSHFLPEKVVAVAFTAFLFFAGTMVYVPKKEVFEEKDSIAYPVFVGALAGFVSGFLGVGGGGIVSPLLIIAGYNPKKVAAATPFIVLFSSFTGFLAYWKLGSVDWRIILWASIPAVVAGYLGALITHRYLKPGHVKKILGVLFFILAIKLLMKFF
jgi:uncharacterized membrane protein YfcA